MVHVRSGQEAHRVLLQFAENEHSTARFHVGGSISAWNHSAAGCFNGCDHSSCWPAHNLSGRSAGPRTESCPIDGHRQLCIRRIGRAEMKATDSVSGELLREVVDQRAGRMGLKSAATLQWGDAQNAMDYWAQTIPQRLSQLKSGTETTAQTR